MSKREPPFHCPRCAKPFPPGRWKLCDCGWHAQLYTEQAIDHPAHYTSGGIETIDVIEAWGLGFHLGNAVKYISRAGRKDPTKTVEDLKKARWYIDREITRIGE